MSPLNCFIVQFLGSQYSYLSHPETLHPGGYFSCGIYGFFFFFLACLQPKLFFSRSSIHLYLGEGPLRKFYHCFY